MNLNASDLAKLYGNKLFVLPKQNTATDAHKQHEEIPSITLPSPYRIRQVAGASLAIVLSETEVADGTLVSLLANILSAIGKTIEKVTEVVIQDEVTEEDLDNVNARFVLVFGEHILPNSSKPYTLASGGIVYKVPALQAMQADISKKRLGWESIKQFKDQL